MKIILSGYGKMNKELEKLVDFNKIDKSMKNINNYFIDHNGSCE